MRTAGYSVPSARPAPGRRAGWGPARAARAPLNVSSSLPGQGEAAPSAGALQHDEAIELRIGAKANAGDLLAVGLDHGEGAVARHLVDRLAVPDVRRREALAVVGGDHDMPESLEYLLAQIVAPAVAGHRTVLHARAGIEGRAHLAQLEARVVVEDVRRIGEHLAALDALVGEQRAHVEHHLLGAVGHRCAALHGRGGALPRATGHAKCDDGDDDEDATHQATLARRKSCRCTTPASRSASSSTGMAMMPLVSMR